MSHTPSLASLTRLGSQRTFQGDHLKEIVFPLGGVGAGSVGLHGSGGLCDWAIFNRPNYGSRLPKTFPMIWAREAGKTPVCRIVQAPQMPPFTVGGGGDPHTSGEGFPHMDDAEFHGEFPFATIRFQCKAVPVTVSLEAYSPFVPNAADDSGFPVAVLKYTLHNPKKNAVDVSLAWSLLNTVGTIGEGEKDRVVGAVAYGYGQNVNEYVERGGLRGVFFRSDKYAPDHPRFGNLALMTPEKKVTVCKYWLRGGWFAPMHEFWDTFSATGMLPDHDYGPSDEGQNDAGALGIRARLKPGERKTFTFYLAWYFPNYEKYLHDWQTFMVQLQQAHVERRTNLPTWKNYYATQFESAIDAAAKLHAREKDLYTQTKRFHEALFSSTLPPYVLDAVSSTLGILRSPTCLRLEDGTFYGFEGCAPVGGCCEGSCTHVWNYQQALPFLFPSLERSMREADYTYNQRDDGHMGFRLQLPLGAAPQEFHAAADGQLGGVIKFYRDWKISGDDRWLREYWPKVKKSLEYAWQAWDLDRDGVMTEIQHNTYDIEFLGPNTMLGTFYLGALVAGAEIAEYLGDAESAATYRGIYESGRAWIEKHLFNGSFYEQQYDPEKAPVHQYGAGCLSDQLLGQQIASLAGLGPLLDAKRIRTTLASIFRHNWKADLACHANAQRVYAHAGEAGLLLCTWPKGGRPAVPFVYSDEVWTGIEYQVAAHCILEGLVKEGLAIVRGLRERFDGVRRNPWDEYECGHHYSRAMAAYGLIPALSGFTYDAGIGAIGFAPRIHRKRFRCFWALDGAWGVYSRDADTSEVQVLYGTLRLSRLDLPDFAVGRPLQVQHGRKRLTVHSDAYGSVTFPKIMTVKAGHTLTLTR